MTQTWPGKCQPGSLVAFPPVGLFPDSRYTYFSFLFSASLKSPRSTSSSHTVGFLAFAWVNSADAVHAHNFLVHPLVAFGYFRVWAHADNAAVNTGRKHQFKLVILLPLHTHI